MKSQETGKEIINDIVQRIVRQFRPEKIILFGSYAKGDVNPDSDVDLLVILPIEGSRRRKTVEIDLALVGVELPVDLIVVTPEEVEKYRNKIGTIIRPAMNEGEVLYERTA
ncbi:MAG: nucleotidyltransferase domain-containing protein [Deltaproteobacteria bacterium]|nr:nucleotidyltransferase domain-containing protein [Deltaproteobacteria bacterium]